MDFVLNNNQLTWHVKHPSFLTSGGGGDFHINWRRLLVENFFFNFLKNS